MKRVLTALLMICMVFLQLSCNNDSNPVESSGDKHIWPLKMGNSWTFHVIAFDSTGAVSGSGTATISVSSDTVVAGERWYHLSNYSQGVYHMNRSDGLWIMVNGMQSLVFKYPAESGESWNYYGNTIVIQSSDTSVVTQSKTYTCYAYSVSYNSVPLEDLYLNPGTGLVADDQYAVTSQGKVYRIFTAVLSSVNLK